MKILPAWLREFVDLPEEDGAIARALTMAGIAVEGIARDDGNTVFETEITTNRPDCMNHFGVARECSAIFNRELKPIEPALPAGCRAEAQVSIVIEDAEGCGRYTARIIRNLKIGPSPEAIRERLRLLGASSISNAVDASNYALQEIGHPTHAFDLEKLAGGRIIVRRARAGEKLKTLDGVERQLTHEDLVIADAEKPVALAGVMGGFDSMITPATRHVLIESAWFDPVRVRKTARRLGMHTDASHRFERGADWGACPLACARVAELILASAGGELEADSIDVIAREVPRHAIVLCRSEIARHLGLHLADEEIQRIMGRLGFKVHPASAEHRAAIMAAAAQVFAREPEVVSALGRHPGWAVMPPTWRLDVESEIDLIEELARIHGYNEFPNTLPAFAGAVNQRSSERSQGVVRSTALALGYDEAISLSFVSAEEAGEFREVTPVQLANPVSEEAPMMRTSLVPGMLQMLSNNLNRNHLNVRLFELGNAFEMAGEAAMQHAAICLGATGDAEPALVTPPRTARSVSFYDIKGDVETLIGRFAAAPIEFKPGSEVPWLHPGRSASLVHNGVTIGCLGELSAAVAAARKFRQPVYVAELFLGPLYEAGLRQPRFEDASRFPAVERDFSVLFPEGVIYRQIEHALRALNIPELRSLRPIEVFRGGAGKAIPAGQYSMLLRTSFQSAERTLRDDQVAGWVEKIMQALTTLGGKLRTE